MTMYRLSLFGLLFFASFSLFGQVYPCPDILIRTDSATAVNFDSNPNKRTNVSFEWRGFSFAGDSLNKKYWIPNPSFNYRLLDTPFNQNNDQLIQFYHKPNQYQSTDGWELIYREMGFTNQTPRAAEGVVYPFFVMYNKFTSTLRVFVNIDSDDSQTEIAIEIVSRNPGGTFGRKNVLFNNNGTLTPVVNSSFAPNLLASKSLFINNASRWHYADFFVGYDPCACIWSSDIEVRVQLIDQANITLRGEATGTLESNINGRAKESSNFFNNVEGVASAGGEFFKTFEAWRNSNTETFRNMGLKISADKLTTFGNSGDFLKAGLGAVPLIGSVFDFFSSFIAGGATKGPQLVTLTPMSINLNLNLNGALTYKRQFDSWNFSTPGSLNAGPGDKYPFYNEPLGVFAILDTPVVYVRKIKYNGLKWKKVSPNNYIVERDFRQSMSFVQVKMMDSINYVLNPASNLKIQEIKFAIEYIPITDRLLDPFFKRLAHVWPNPTPLNFKNNPNRSSPFGQSSYGRTRYVDIGHAKYSSVKLFDSELVPITRYSTSSSGRGLKLRLILNLERADQFATDSTQNVIMVLTYPVKAIPAPSDFDWSAPDDDMPPVFNARGWRDYSEPDVVSFTAHDSVIIDEQTVFDNHPPHTEFHIYSQHISYYTRDGRPSSIIPARVKRFPLHPEPIFPRATVGVEIDQACRSSAYIASTNQRRRDEDDKPTTTLEQRDEEVTPLRLSPNPAVDRVTLTFDQQQIGDAEVLVRDILGQPVLRQRYPGLLPNCAQQVELATGALTPGLYIVTLTVDGRSHSQRLSIQR
jgi:hypothetical protein